MLIEYCMCAGPRAGDQEDTLGERLWYLFFQEPRLALGDAWHVCTCNEMENFIHSGLEGAFWHDEHLEAPEGRLFPRG